MPEVLRSPAAAPTRCPASTTDMSHRGWPFVRPAALALMFVSGFAGLACQIVWTERSALALGHESAAVLAVLVAFFGGLGMGALASDRWIRNAPDPRRWYAACEAVIGLWSLLLIIVMPAVSPILLDLVGSDPAPAWQWTIVFAASFVLLLPATVAMGATLPAMARVIERHCEATGEAGVTGATVAGLYAANTGGAVAGALLATFVMLPALGLATTTVVCGLLNAACALLILAIPLTPLKPVAHRVDEAPLSAAIRRNTLLLLAASGFLGIGYEVVVVRALSQVADNTVYTYALVLAVYLIGTAIGAAAYARYRGTEDLERTRDALALLAALAIAGGAMTLSYASAIKSAMLAWLEPSLTSALAGEVLIAALAFLLPTMAMGALFCALSARAIQSGASIGQALGVNTLAAAIAPLVIGTLLVSMLDIASIALLLVIGYGALARPARWTGLRHWCAMVIAIVVVVVGAPQRMLEVARGARLVHFAEGPLGAVSVIERSDGVRSLHINNREAEGSNATRFTDGRQALLPLALHPSPRHALFLGMGTGVTSATAAMDPTLHVVVVELVPEVVAASAWFVAGPVAGSALAGAHRPRTVVADARRFVRTAQQRYDVIVSDNFHPARSGSASLYTVEHFAAVRNRLAEGGVFCQWLPLHQLDVATLRSIVRSFQSIYPGGFAMLATNSLDTPVIGLVSTRDGAPFDVERVRSRLADQPLTGARTVEREHDRGFDPFGLDDAWSVLGSLIAGPRSLLRFAGDAPVNTDDLPIVAWRAPAALYQRSQSPRDRLDFLMHSVDITPEETTPHAALADRERLAAYWRARGRFIAVGRNVVATSDPRRMLDQVQRPLLKIAAMSPDFRPAYDPLLQLATALGRSDPLAARMLVDELQRVRRTALAALNPGAVPSSGLDSDAVLRSLTPN